MSKIESELYLKFSKFIANLPYNSNYDCSEVVGDFSEVAEGIVYEARNAENKFGIIYVLQNGIVIPYEYHQFYVYKDYVYDPFLCTSIIKYREYSKNLTAFNLARNVRVSIRRL